MSKLERLIQQYCPDGVEYVKLGNICNIKGRIGFRGYTRDDQVKEGEGALSLSPSNIQNGQMDYTKGTFISWEKYNESPEIITYDGDIIFCKTASVGKVALVKNLPYAATINPQLVVLKDIKCNAPFLTYVLGTDSFQKKVISMAGVGSVPNIPQKSLADLEIPLPPLPVQEEIVRILDTFTELQAELQAELQKRQQQYNFYRDNLLNFNRGGQEIKWMKMSDVFEIRNGYTPSKANNDFWEGGTIPWFRMEDIRQNGRILSDSISHITPKGVKGKGLFSANSFIIATTATIGEHALLIADSLANQRFTNLKIRKSLEKELSIKFFYYYLFIIDEWCKSNINLSNFASVDMVKFNNLRIPIPPLEEQNRIVSILDRFDTLTNDLTSGLPAEMEKRRQQYEYYRDRLLTFKRL